MKANFSIAFSLILFAFVLLLVQTLFNISFGQQNNTIILPHSNSFASQTSHYLYGCTNYVQAFHCDPISNKFQSYGVHANFTKITSATRQPSYVESKSETGIRISAHSWDSLRANIIDAYNTNQFSIDLSFKPGKYDENLKNPYVTLASYRSGLKINDRDTAGWNIELIPNNSTSMKTVRFSVFNTNGSSLSPRTVDISIDKFSEIVGTFDGKTIRLFIDGILKSETPFIGNYSGKVDHNNFLKIAGEPYCFCYGLNDNSVLNEVRYYNYSLDEDQIKRINSQNDLLGRGLVGYWKFDGDLKDYSGFKNDMFYNTLIGSMAFAPDGRLFFSEKNSGNIRVMVNDTAIKAPFASIPNVYIDWEEGLLGLAIDSKFKDNHFIYVYYNYKDTDTGKIYARILRFTDIDNKGIDETVILDKIPASKGYHTGGALAFNKIDDKLYVTVGDATRSVNCGNLPDSTGEICPAQDPKSLLGKVLRINRDGTIPYDNPFPKSPVYNYGHRNMYGIAFDEQGHGIVTEAGQNSYDEINSLVKGGNYGWPTLQQADTAPNPLSPDSSIKPMRSYYISLPPTQATYYNGDKFPELKGMFIAGSFRGDLYAYKISEDGKKLLEELRLNTTVYPSKGVVATAVSPRGDIYFGAYDIFRLDKIELTHKGVMMIPVEIVTTNANVSNVNYSQNKGITLNLTNRNTQSTIAIKIPDSYFEGNTVRYECKCNNSHSQSTQTYNETQSRLDFRRLDDYGIMRIQLLTGASEIPQITIDTDGCIAT
jgi:glucose/arabinose dehydrogenase